MRQFISFSLSHIERSLVPMLLCVVHIPMQTTHLIHQVCHTGLYSLHVSLASRRRLGGDHRRRGVRANGREGRLGRLQGLEVGGEGGTGGAWCVDRALGRGMQWHWRRASYVRERLGASLRLCGGDMCVYGQQWLADCAGRAAGGLSVLVQFCCLYGRRMQGVI